MSEKNSSGTTSCDLAPISAIKLVSFPDSGNQHAFDRAGLAEAVASESSTTAKLRASRNQCLRAHVPAYDSMIHMCV